MPKPNDRPRAEYKRAAAWEHLATMDEPGALPEGRLAEVADRLDRLIEDGYVSADHAGPTDLLAALLVIRQIREDLTKGEKWIIESARRQNITWSRIADALEVGSRQAAERRWASLREDFSGLAATQRERVLELRDERAEERAQARWCAEHAEQIRAAARALLNTGRLAERAEAAAYRHELRKARTPVLPPTALPRATWVRRLQELADDPGAAPEEVLLAAAGITYADMAELAAEHPEETAEVRRLLQGHSRARQAVAKARLDARYGPDDEEDEDDLECW